jgi:hypothetical protein
MSIPCVRELKKKKKKKKEITMSSLAIQFQRSTQAFVPIQYNFVDGIDRKYSE